MASIESLADQWLAVDKDEETRQEILDLLRSKNVQELESRLRGRIEFGTAGLRAKMCAGFTRMNCVTVIQTSQGLAAYVQSCGLGDKGIVVGRDARRNSQRFAELAAAAFMAYGIRVHWLSECHTPLVPFAVKHLSAAAGVMVTASHNPAQDNGYKVYWMSGCQIIPPHDTNIARSIEEHLPPSTWDTQLDANPLFMSCKDTLLPLYCDAVKQEVALTRGLTLPSFVYTPMHGVGYSILLEATKNVMLGHINSPSHKPLEDIVRDTVRVVEQQARPDPAFPTVKFPNPEEAGALDLAMQKADASGITLVIANDPDADRMAVAEKLANGSWYQFTGNEVGVLLAASVLERSEWQDRTKRSKMILLNSTVSTGMLAAMAKAEGFQFQETLTGFKWLGNVAQSLESDTGVKVPYAFEEALGYMFTSVGHDKDGVLAALVFLAAVARWRGTERLSPWQKLQRLYASYGFFASANTYLVSPSPRVIETAFEAVRCSAGLETRARYPSRLGSRNITSWRDLTLGYDSTTEDNVPVLPTDAKSQMITVSLEDHTRFTIRGSGTEPKLKLYIESWASTIEDAQQTADEVQQDLIRLWFNSEKFGFVPASQR